MPISVRYHIRNAAIPSIVAFESAVKQRVRSNSQVVIPHIAGNCAFLHERLVTPYILQFDPGGYGERCETEGVVVRYADIAAGKLQSEAILAFSPVESAHNLAVVTVSRRILN